jgi:hypothetical protein
MDSGNANGNDGILLQAQANSTIKATVVDSTLTSARGDILQFDLAASAPVIRPATSSSSATPSTTRTRTSS